MDEERRDGPGGAAGKAKDSHTEHRWVTTKFSMLTIVLGFCNVLGGQHSQM